MAHIVREMPWGTIDLDTNAPRVFFQQRWFYHWITMPGATPWTLPEKRNFHNTLDRQIWATWSNRVVFRVSGVTPLARRLARTGVPINFDVRWVRVNGHWDVYARKLPPGGSFRSNVVFARREINLDSEDLAPHGACQDLRPPLLQRTCAPNFHTVPHEFGHTIDNRDEYASRSPHYSDTRSIMNIGGEIRGRHLELIIQQLNNMAPGCTFTIPPDAGAGP